MGGFFIFGAPRTGSTLLRRVLLAHSQISIPPESPFLIDYLAAVDVPLERRLSLLANDQAYEHWGSCLPEEILRDSASIPEAIVAMHVHYAQSEGKVVWGQKTPRMVRSWELLAAAFPEAKFIHTTRDPRAVTASLRRSPAHMLDAYSGARRWANDTAIGLVAEAELTERILRVPYEALVETPVDQCRAICTFLGVDFEASMVAAKQAVRLNPNEAKNGHHSQVAAPINAESLDRWTDDLSPRSLSVIGSVTADVAAEIGYAVDAGQIPPFTRIQSSVRLSAIGVFKLLRDITRRRPFLRVWRRRLLLGTFWRNATRFFSGQ
jgi:LPS sulfotransferase NodH